MNPTHPQLPHLRHDGPPRAAQPLRPLRREQEHDRGEEGRAPQHGGEQRAPRTDWHHVLPRRLGCARVRSRALTRRAVRCHPLRGQRHGALRGQFPLLIPEAATARA